MGQAQGDEHGATRKQGKSGEKNPTGRKGKIRRARAARDCGDQEGTPITPVSGPKLACGKSLLLLWGTGTLTPPGPLPALFFSVFLWEPFTSSKREVCVYFSSLPFGSNSPLFFCQRVRNKFRFKRQPEMCMHAQNCFIFIMP